MEQRDNNIVFRIEFEPGNRAVAYDGDAEIGECVFDVNGNVWTIIHTGVADAYGGHGLAGKLLDKVVNEAKAEGAKIKPVCSYAVRKFSENPEYQEIQLQEKSLDK